MEQGKSVLERAFELAATGTVASVEQIKKQLKGEGCDLRQVEGRSLGNQLRDLIRTAQLDHDRSK